MVVCREVTMNFLYDEEQQQFAQVSCEQKSIMLPFKQLFLLIFVRKFILNIGIYIVNEKSNMLIPLSKKKRNKKEMFTMYIFV